MYDTEPHFLDATDPHRLNDLRLEHVGDEDMVARVIEHLSEQREALGHLVNLYAGAVYKRKNELTCGSVSDKLDKSRYRGSEQHYVVRLELVVPTYSMSAPTKELFDRIAELEESAERQRIEGIRQDKLTLAERLREEADALEAQAAELTKP